MKTLVFLTNLLLCGFSFNAQNLTFEKNINLQGGDHNSLTLSYPAYHITPNTTGTKQYYYNKLNIENSGFYIYDEVNETAIHKDDFTSPIGDCIYNPFVEGGEFLVSQNKGFESGGPIEIYRYADDNNNTLVGTISLPDMSYAQNAKEMFIDPNGTLYVMVNTKVGDINIEGSPPAIPYILMFDATTTDYIPSGSFDLGMPLEEEPPYFLHEADYYMTHFCWSNSNSTLYFTVTPQELTLPPYQSEYNSMYSTFESYIPNKGNLFSINNGAITTEKDDINNPGKIICPDDGNDSHQSVFENKVFILSDNLIIFNISNKNVDFASMIFNDIAYSAENDRLFGFTDEPNPATCNDDRRAIVYEITIDEYQYVFTPLFSYEGQIASFFLSPNNNKLYIHTKFDNHKLGAKPSQLIQFDLETNSQPQEDDIIDLQSAYYGQNKSFYPELDHCPDYHYFNYNLTTPYINPYKNKIYLPNGAHSNVSVVDFTDQLILNEGTNWISIPRHSRFDDPFGNYTSIESVFDADNFENGYNTFLLEYLQPTFNTTTPYKVTWNQQDDWDYDPDDPDNRVTYSTRGYKITLNLTHQNNALQLSGLLEPSGSTIKLYADEENWVGYFLHEKQYILDAVADFEDDLYYIKARHWCCVRTVEPPDGGTPQQQFPFLCGGNEPPNIKYGDMVVLKSYEDHIAEEDRFYWNYSGNPPQEGIDEELVYYSYTETSDYSAMVIELDSTENPVEIGAFVNDSCIGACTLTPEDTTVIIQGYLGDQSGDSVVFEEYFATKSTNKNRITDYYVYNPEKRIKEKRVVKTGENKDIYYISFSAPEKQLQHNMDELFSVYPNPASNKLVINYSVEELAKVVISVYDSYGRAVATVLQNNMQPEGIYSLDWNLTNNTGKKLSKGLYIIKLKLNDNVMSRKVVVN